MLCFHNGVGMTKTNMKSIYSGKIFNINTDSTENFFLKIVNRFLQYVNVDLVKHSGDFSYKKIILVTFRKALNKKVKYDFNYISQATKTN